MQPITTLSVARHYLGLSEGGTAADNIQIERMIETVSARIVAICRQPVVRETGNVVAVGRFFSVYSPQRNAHLIGWPLDYFPATVDSLTYIDNGETVTVSSGDYTTAAGWLDYPAADRGREYSVTLTVGYPPESMELRDIEQVALEMLAVSMREGHLKLGGAQGRGLVGVASETESIEGRPTKSRSYQVMSDSWYERLAPYRRATL